MGWVDWSKLTSKQKVEAAKARPAWHLSDFRKFAFWVYPDGHVSRRRGSHQLGLIGCAEFVAILRGDVRSRGDNRD
jgi:hypothetical protein